MRRAVAPALAVLLAGAAQAESPKSLPPFERLAVDTAMSVEVVCGPAPEMRVAADPPVVGARYLDAETRDGRLRLHFRRDFDRHVHPDQVAIRLTVDRPLRAITATTGARLAVPPCALPETGLVVQVETGARVELAGTTGTVEARVLSGGALNALSGGRDFFAAAVRLEAGPGTRVGLCAAQSVTAVQVAADALILRRC